MLPAWLAFVVFGAIILLLLGIATYADRRDGPSSHPVRRKLTYVLAICVYASSWSVFCSIGMASRQGLDVLPLLVGPAVLFAFFTPLVRRVVRLSKGQTITSVSDFVAVRYGKTTSVGVTVAVVVVIGTIPFVGLQLHVISQSLSIFADGRLPGHEDPRHSLAIAAGAAVGIAALTVAIGARRRAAPDQQRGLMLAVAVGSVANVVALVAVCGLVCWGMYKGLGDLTERVADDARISAVIDAAPTPAHWVAMIVFSFAAALVMPREFHVTVVGNRQESDVRSAAWFVPVYVIVSSLMILPIAAAGLVTFPDATFDRDFTIFALPIHAKSAATTLIALVGVLSAATTTIVASVTALAVIVTNDLVMPVALRLQSTRRRAKVGAARSRTSEIRCLSAAAVVAAAWLCTAFIPSKALSAVAFAFLVGVVQIGPAAIGALVWEHGTARGAIGGCLGGLLVWGYTLLLPAISAKTSPLVTDGPLGLDALRPTDLFDLNVPPLDQAILWTLSVNALVYVVVSLSRRTNANERLQASLYVRGNPVLLAPSLRLSPVNVATGHLLATTSFYVGAERAEPQFRTFHGMRDLAFDPGHDAEPQLLRFAENLIASAIGAASSRTVISHLLARRERSNQVARRIVDDVTFEVQNSHDILQHAIDLARDGMAVFDRDLRLVAWNRAYRDMFRMPAEMMRLGTPLDVLVRCNAERGIYGPGAVDDLIAERLEALTQPTESLRLYSALVGRVFEMHSVRLHNGGLFFTYFDATAQVKSEEELEAENVTLEARVRERTEELQTLNFELARAKADAEDANVSKTRFLAAASHDLLQPLNAARLYTTSLRERLRAGSSNEDAATLATHVDASLESVEDILGALLEISHLDAGATKTEMSVFAVDSVLRQLQIEFVPLARERGLRLRIVRSSAWVLSDRRLLSRLLQNLISNAVKYTHEGSVLVGVRRRGADIRIDVHDTGLGIPEAKQSVIFREFERLPAAVRVAGGVGLGLSIVERLARVLKHEIKVRSQVGKGSTFSVAIPRAEAIPLGPAGGLGVGAAVRQRSLEGLAVVAIDNERHILRGMEILLEGWDCVVVTGTGLTDAETALAERTIVPDVILADYHIAEVDGLDVIAALRARFGYCPAVLITADRNPAVRNLAQDADVRVLNKPLKPAALRALLSQWRLVKAAAE